MYHIFEQMNAMNHFLQSLLLVANEESSEKESYA